MLQLAKSPEPQQARREPPLKQYKKRWNTLKTERSSWDATWQDLADNLLPNAGQLLSDTTNQGEKRDIQIINSTPLRSVRVFAAGMMSGITSPARPWFRLTTPDPMLAEAGAVRSWLHVVEERIREAIAGSNLYNILHQVYVALGVYSTAAALVEEDADTVIRAYFIPNGRYVLATSARGEVNTLYRRSRPTINQVVEMFGLENCSQSVRDQYNRGNGDSRIPVIHVLEPNKLRVVGRLDSKNKPWRSCWFEESRNEQESKPFLRESGYDEFPVMAPRWDVLGDDVYGRGPGMVALGDSRALQRLETRKIELVDKLSAPPVGVTGDLIGDGMDLTPGAVNPLPMGGDVKSLVVVHPQALAAVRESIQDHEQRINAAFFADLWLMMADSDRRQITATEIAERHEEKMLQLGPVLERLEGELLRPLIDRVFGILWRRGRLPPPPDELRGGQDIKVDFISVLAQAQKMVATGGIERLAGFVGNLAGAKPEVLDKLNTDECVDEYANAIGVKPDLIVPDDQVKALRDQRAQQQAMAQQAAQAQQMAQGAKVMSETDMGGDTALNRLLGGIGAPPGGVQQ